MKLLEWLSVLLNIMGGGDPDESLSARLYRTASPRTAWVDRLLGPGHCAITYARTRDRQLRRYGVRP